MHKVIFITGVSGSGKTTIGRLLSQKTGYSFYDADDFHPQQNINKMRSGKPLTDEDRWPWLDNLHHLAIQKLQHESIIIACSALKQAYRKRLSNGIEADCRWVFLKGSYATIQQRMHQRKDHYMPAALLQSQFDALELPADAIEVAVEMTPEAIVSYIMDAIR